MKEMQLNEIQALSLSILKDVNSFCKQNGISYSVAGGTLLGAVRHKGFIPWDDDVDIMMPRKDYERFCKMYHSEFFNLVSFHNDKSCMISYARVCDFKHTFVNHQTWTRQRVGVWVDVFPFDGADADFNNFKKSYLCAEKLWRSTYRYRAFYDVPKKSNTFYLNMAVKINKLLHTTFLIKAIGRRKVRLLDSLSQKIPFGQSEFVSQYVFCKPGTKEYYHLSSFLSYVELPFEDISVSAISGFEEYLKHFYGDYLVLPPENCRQPKQDYLAFYWL